VVICAGSVPTLVKPVPAAVRSLPTCGYLCGVGTDPSEAGTGRSEVVTDLLKAGTDFIEAVPAQSKPVPSEHEVGTGF
jgi:hypothetical protein